MVDYPSSNTGGMRGIWIFVASAIVVLLLLYALFTGDNVSTTMDTGMSEAPLAEETMPAVPAEPAQ